MRTRITDRDRARLEGYIEAVSEGDRAAFSRLYDSTSAKLFGVTLRVLNDRDMAEDVLQETYVKIWRGAARYRPGTASPMTWLITIARNSAIDRLRRRATSQAERLDEASAPVADPRPGPAARAVAVSELVALKRCLDELPDERAQAIRGAYLDGDTYQVLADRHGIPLNTMRTWLRRSLMRLRECLGR